jgi:hypothetical protein
VGDEISRRECRIWRASRRHYVPIPIEQLRSCESVLAPPGIDPLQMSEGPHREGERGTCSFTAGGAQGFQRFFSRHLGAAGRFGPRKVDFSVEERQILIVQLVLILDDAEMELGAVRKIDTILHDELAALDPSPKD